MDHVRSSLRRLAATLFAASLLAGCLSGPGTSPALVNSLVASGSQFDILWERTVHVLNENHFMIARESKLERVIETEYRAGANLLEPWHPDSVGFENRLESTLQSIRRKVTVSFGQSGQNQMLISVRVDKEIEDLPGPAANNEGGATFPEADPLSRDLSQVVGQSSPSRWLPAGRDALLEARIASQIRNAAR